MYFSKEKDNEISFISVYLSIFAFKMVSEHKELGQDEKNHLLICITSVVVNGVSNVFFLVDYQLLKLKIGGSEDLEKKKCQFNVGRTYELIS